MLLPILFTSLLMSQLHAQTERPVGWFGIVPNVLQDQKQIWTSPVRAVRKKNLKPVILVAAVTAALIATDAHSAGYFRQTDTFQGFNSKFTSHATSVGMVIAPSSLYVLGLATKDKYAQHTALLAGEAVIDAEIVTTVLKDIDNRKRPAAYPPGGTLGDSWFDGGTSWVRGRGSFPSGHTIAAFSIATVISRRYPHKRWVPFVSYGLASLVGFSRISLSAHFPSDVFAGAAMGYAISRFAVLHQ
jgi:membrane-associated phospholipid phosphatase